MIKPILYYLIILLSGLCSASSAFADRSYSLTPDVLWTNQPVGWWVIAKNAERNTCLATGIYGVDTPNETLIWLGVERSREAGFAAFGNAAWSFIEIDKQYPLVLTFDGKADEQAVGTGAVFKNKPVIILDGLSMETVNKIAKSRTVELSSADQGILDNYSLRYTKKALAAIDKCIAATQQEALNDNAYAYLGIQMSIELTEDQARQSGSTDLTGAYILDVAKESPAEKSGLKAFDIIRKINGKTIINPNYVKSVTSGPGSCLEIEVLRNGSTKTVRLIVGDRRNNKKFLQSGPIDSCDGYITSPDVLTYTGGQSQQQVAQTITEQPAQQQPVAADDNTRRLALVVGIDNYQNVAQLKKAVNDSKAVSTALQKIGYDVVSVENPDRRTMSSKLQEFQGKIQPGDTAFFFFAGHGVALGPDNILLAADVPKLEPGQDDIAKDEGFSVENIIRRFQKQGAKTAMLVLDACRNNPFETDGTRSVGNTRGLAKQDAPEGVFVLFSAGLGQEALDRLSDEDPDPNSVFTRKLVPALMTPSITHNDLAKRVQKDVSELAATINVKQQPAYYDQIVGEIPMNSLK